MRPPSGSSWRRRAGTFCSPQVRRRGLQSTRRTATTMPAPAAGAASGLAVLSRASRPQPRPPMHWRRPCALIWSIWSPVSCRWQAGGSSTSMLPEHGQLMQYDVHDTSTSSCTHGSATGMVRWQPLCRICTRLHATRVERAAEATSARVASAGTAQSGSSRGSQLASYHCWSVCCRGSGGVGRRGPWEQKHYRF